MRAPSSTRREFVGMVAPLLLAGLRPFRSATAVRSEHPTPRTGIDASHVLTANDLKDSPGVVPVFDMVREIPTVADGIRCQCECAQIPQMYSLLSCFEKEGMARHCHICQGVARLVYRMHKGGSTLEQIRGAVDEGEWR